MVAQINAEILAGVTMTQLIRKGAPVIYGSVAVRARLDDLHKTGTVSETIYKMKRTELVNALAHLYYRLRHDSPATSKKAGRREDPARV